MAKRRIFQIAKELNISHTEILSFLEGKGIEVASHMAPIEEDVYKIVLSEFHKDKESVERYRKEQVRREIHDTRILEQQKANKKGKLKLLKDDCCNGTVGGIMQMATTTDSVIMVVTRVIENWMKSASNPF